MSVLEFDCNQKSKFLTSVKCFSSKEYKEFLHNANKSESGKLNQAQQLQYPLSSTNGGQYLHGAKESFNLINNALQDIGKKLKRLILDLGNYLLNIDFPPFQMSLTSTL